MQKYNLWDISYEAASTYSLGVFCKTKFIIHQCLGVQYLWSCQGIIALFQNYTGEVLHKKKKIYLSWVNCHVPFSPSPHDWLIKITISISKMRDAHPQTHFLTVCSSLAGWKQRGRRAEFLSACWVPKPRDQDMQWTMVSPAELSQSISKHLSTSCLLPQALQLEITWQSTFFLVPMWQISGTY